MSPDRSPRDVAARDFVLESLLVNQRPAGLRGLQRTRREASSHSLASSREHHDAERRNVDVESFVKCQLEIWNSRT